MRVLITKASDWEYEELKTVPEREFINLLRNLKHSVRANRTIVSFRDKEWQKDTFDVKVMIYDYYVE